MATARSLLALTLVARVSARTTLSFDAAWEFILGDEPGWAPATCSIPYDINVTGTRCDGLQSLGAFATAEACYSAACGEGLGLYQWCDAATGCTSGTNGSCWAGSLTDCAASNQTAAGWISYGTNAPPTPAPFNPAPPPPPTCPGDRACADYDDSAWRTVSTPHDYVDEGAPTPTADRNHGYLPYNFSWYRKHFNVDASWQGQPVWLGFDGVYRASDYWLNGVWIGHWESGYAPFNMYIHNATGATLNYGTTPNVLAVRVDGATHQEGWFYEGSGIYRSVTIETAPALNLVPWGVYAPSLVTGAISSPAGLAGPQTASGALLSITLDVQNSGATADAYSYAVALVDATGATVATASGAGPTLPPGGWARNSTPLTLTFANLWSVSTPYLYTLAVSLTATNAKTVDAVNVTVGVRSAIFDANKGFLLNGLPVQIQGFSQHQDFGGLGTAVPHRVQEYRVSSVKAIGCNGWRTAHNPVNKDLLDITDRLGMLVWSENRNLERQVIGGDRRGGVPNQVINISQFPDPQYLMEAQQMVLRDRNHPSIIIWSLCNEGAF